MQKMKLKERVKAWGFRALAGGAMLAPMAAHASGASSDPTTVVSGAGTLLTTIYPIVLGAVTFFTLIGIAKAVKRK